MAVSLTHAFTTSISDGSTTYTGNFTSGSPTITSVNPTPPASGATGFKLFGGPFAAGTTISSVSGTTITMSANASSTAAGATFYSGDDQVQASDWNAQHTLSLAQGNILGRRAAAGTGAAVEIPLSFDATNNVTFPGQVNFAAGTTTVAPLDFAAGTNLTTATAGAMEYDGHTLMFTPKGTERGLVPGMQFYCLNTAFVGANSTATQSIFGLTNGVTLSSSTMYAFEMEATLLKTAGTTSHTVRILFGGTATLNSILYDARVNCAPAGLNTYAGSASQQGVTANVATVITTTGTLPTANVYWTGLVKGVVSINAGGTFHPQYSLSAAPGGAYTTQVGSYFAIWPIGPSGSNVNIGTWS